MELGLRELLTLVTVLGGGIATVRVIETKLARIILDIKGITEELEKQSDKLDAVESGKAVTEIRVEVFRDILSPRNLRDAEHRSTRLESRLNELDTHVRHLNEMHNGRHPLIGGRDA